MPKGVVGCGQLPRCPVRRPASARQTQEEGIGQEGLCSCLGGPGRARPGKARGPTRIDHGTKAARAIPATRTLPRISGRRLRRRRHSTHTPFPPNSLRRNSAMSAYRKLQCTPSPAPEILAISKFTLSRWCRLLHERTCGCSSIGPGQKQGCAHFRLPPPASSSWGRAGWPGRRLRTYWG